MRFVLHYLERRWSGSGIREDITNVAARFDVGPEIERKQTQIVENLDHALAIDPRSTLSVLHDTYALRQLSSERLLSLSLAVCAFEGSLPLA